VLEPRDGELTVTTIHPGATVEQVQEATGWKLRVADRVAVTEPAADEELRALEELLAR
jgi:acyl CoA:acetate/3-ketoacid CoA transferase beta subunit